MAPTRRLRVRMGRTSFARTTAAIMRSDACQQKKTMTFLTRYRALLLSAAVLCGGCSTPAEPVVDEVLATINGIPFHASFVTKNRTSTRLQVSGGTMQQIVTFAVNRPSAPGTVLLKDGDFNSYALYADGPSTNKPTWATSAAGSGSVTFITLTETSATGTFTFTAGALPNTPATGTKSITSGTFTVRW
jgi:hypothetical protein